MSKGNVLGWFSMLALVFFISAGSASAALVFQVTNASDDGVSTSNEHTLRGAIASANGNTGLDIIVFDLGGNSITVLAPLLITDPVSIQGTRTEVIGGNSSFNLFIVAGGGTGTNITGLALVNSLTGILINAANVEVTGCVIGTDWSDSSGKGNTIGISVSNATQAVIGKPSTPTYRNIISGNATGVSVTNSSNILFQNNYVGLKSDGVTILGNSVYGIRFSSNAWCSRIGGDMTSGQGNVISGNGYGVYCDGSDSGGNTICGNIIGLNAGQSSKVANNYGIILKDTSGNWIGLNQAGFGNVVSGNTWAGITLQSVGARPRLNTIQNNILGSNTAGSTGLGNSMQGIYITGDSNLIGGRFQETWYERNWVAGNASSGVIIIGNGNTISGNSIGLNQLGTLAMANQAAGLGIQGNGNLIGGPNTSDATNRGNLISGNASYGIALTGGAGNTLVGNIIGLNQAGTTAIANQRGIDITGTVSELCIGGTAAGLGNIISGNNNLGIDIGSSGTCSHGLIQGNWIGSNKAGTSEVPNSGGGIYVLGMTDSWIGGPEAAARNIICGPDTGNGIVLSGTGVYGNTLAGNWIGQLPYSHPSVEMNFGIYLVNAVSNNWIGLPGGPGNLITHTNTGIYFLNTTATQDPLYGNTICGFSGAYGIQLSGGNNGKLAPTINLASTSSISGSSEINDYIEVFVADRGNGYQGGSIRLLGTAITDGSNHWAITPAGLLGGEFITAIATNSNQNSSGFAANLQVPPPTPTITPTRTATATRTATFTPTPTFTMSKTATVSPTASMTATASATASETATVTPTPSNTITMTLTLTATITPTATPTLQLPTATQTPRIAITATASITTTPMASITSTTTPRPITDDIFNGKLFQFYPNPASDTLKIVLQTVAHSGSVRMEIHNLAGERVGQVVLPVNAGRHQLVTWDCREIAIGLYMVEVFLDNQALGKRKCAIVR